MDLIGVRVDLRFMFFILDLDQYIDEIDPVRLSSCGCAYIFPLISMCNIMLVLDY